MVEVGFLYTWYTNSARAHTHTGHKRGAGGCMRWTYIRRVGRNGKIYWFLFLFSFCRPERFGLCGFGLHLRLIRVRGGVVVVVFDIRKMWKGMGGGCFYYGKWRGWAAVCEKGNNGEWDGWFVRMRVGL